MQLVRSEAVDKKVEATAQKRKANFNSEEHEERREERRLVNARKV